jgi:vacuolar-type H+-ATPase subunit H
LLQQQAEQSRDLAGLQIKTISEQIVAKATEALDRQVGKSTRTVADLGEQARVGLESQGQKIEMEAKNSLWEYQRQIEQSSSASLDKFRKDTGVLLDEVVFRLQQSVRSFQSATGDEVLAELQKASDNLLEVSAAQMRKQTEQSLDLITERLKEKEEEVVSDAANVFRNRIADIFAILQEGSKKTSDLPDPERLKKQT